MRAVLRYLGGIFLGLAGAVQVMAAQSGWRQIDVPGASDAAPPMRVALFYPTQAAASHIVMGPFSAQVAVQAEPEPQFKGLIVVSHGIGGTEQGHNTLAVGLAQQGYLVAALRHPGDNWQDDSLFKKGAVPYFGERPQHISRVIDALLQDPLWGPRIATDVHGPRIGAMGHSAGGYTVLAVAGGQPDVARILAHCQQHRDDDPIFCSLGGKAQAPAPVARSDALEASDKQVPDYRDPRVRAVVALSPTGVMLTADSLAKITIPTAVYFAEQDRFLVPRFHAQWIAAHLPKVQMHAVSNAWHFAFMDAPSMPIPTPDGDIAADPPGFDRPVFLQQLQKEIGIFFDTALQ
jgi:predicted dienelactone hydrolase